MANCDSNKNINKTFIIEPLELTAGTPTISACTAVYTSKVLACSGDTFIELYSGVTINGDTLINNSLSANTIDASIILSGGTNILDIVNANDTFVTGGTFNDIGDSLSLLRNDGNSIVITGITDFFTTGATLVNETIVFDRKDALSAYTVDISSVNSGDTFVTGGTLVNKELILDRNDSLSAVTVDLSGLTSNSGSGLNYNGTTGKIDLGGDMTEHVTINGKGRRFRLGTYTGNYANVSDECIFFNDRAANARILDLLVSSPGLNGSISDRGSSFYRTQFGDTSTVNLEFNPTSGLATLFHKIYDSDLESSHEIWESSGSTKRSYSKQTFDEFKWNVYNNVGGDNAASKTFFQIESERIVAGAVNSGGTKFGIFQFSPLNIQFLDGDFKGIFTAPSTTYVGDVTKSYLSIVNNLNVSDDSFFNDGTSNKRGIKYKGFGETNTETGAGANYSTLVGTSLVPKKYVDDYISSPSGNTFVTGTTFANNQLNIALNNGTSVGTTIDNLSGLTVDGNVLVNGDVNIIGSATTINSEQVLIKDNIITLNSNVTGSTTPVLNSGFEVLRGSGDTKSILWLENTDLWSIDDDLSVSGYVSGTTYYGDGSNLTGIDDTFVTGGTYSGSTIILNRNDGNSVNVTGITSSNIYTADGTLSGDRTFNLNDNTLDIRPDSTNKRFEFLRSANNPILDVYDSFNTRVISLGKDSGGSVGNFLYVNSKLEVGTSNSIILQKSASNSYLKFSNGFNDPYTQIGALIPHYFLAAAGALDTHKFIVGNNSVVSGEDISLQGDTLISKKLELSTTDNGMLMPRLTTAQMNAISSPDTHLLIFNTDLNALYRYNSSAWVAMTAGYGIVSTVDSSGNPTFYATVKAAYDAGAGNVKLHTDYEETTSNPINIVNNRNVDLNGFTYTYNVADGTSIFEDTTQNNSIRVTNGRLIRKNGTGSDYVINCNLTQTRMDILNVYAENENGLCLNLRTTLNGSGSEFVSNNTSGNGFFFNTGSIVSFGKYINENNGGTQFNGAEIKFAEFVCLGSGMNYMGGNIFNSRFISNSGRAMLTGSATKIYDCYLESSSSNALDMRNNSEIYNSTIISDGTVCVNTVGSTATKMIGCTVKGSNSVYSVNSLSLVEDCIIVNSGTGKGIEVNATTQIINNIITLEAGTADAIDLNTYVNSLVSGNKIFVNDPSATGIVSANVNVYIVDNKIKGTTLGVDLGSGVNIWTATTDAHGNSVQL